MVDISTKPRIERRAAAQGKVFISQATAEAVLSAGLPKGNPFEVARLAGIQAAKDTARLIPLCHNLNLDFVDVTIELREGFFLVSSQVSCRWATGVEMEALTAVSVAALTLYDMCKAVDKSIEIGEIRLLSKEKGSVVSDTP
ncbi:MAG: cyclic pyranopterin monophosphate synthase MoaC [Acidobacteriota bacterium]|nr:MAG: cyclic pyranopterin monophosphate synthase MoaC [Acidobacteriota bacterium]